MAEDAKPDDKPASPPLPPIAGKAKDLEALRSAVVDAANVSGAMWLSYLFVLLYLVVSVGSVTHRSLFFETAVKLPFLGVELPLVGFFTLGPLIFLVVHAYVLLHFAMLADKVGAFHAELLAQIADDDIRTRLRRQLPSNIFVQFLAGPRELRTGLMGLMLRLIALISLVAGPIALLVFFQIQFLPYHHEIITWWQRIAVVLDLALLWALWPSVARGETASIGWRDFRHGRVIAAAAASLMPVLFVWTIATFPGEWLDRNLNERRWIPWGSEGGQPHRVSIHKLLFAGDVDLVAGKPTSVWSNRLVLPRIDLLEAGKFDSDAKIAAVNETFSLRDRQLGGAVLLGARLRKVDFTAANLRGAVFDDADLREAKFECAASRMKVDGVSAEQKRFQDAATRCTQLQRASFDRARMQGAKLDEAQLQGASLYAANLQGASFAGAQLQAALLDRAEMQGALFDAARMEGASLISAQLQGVSLFGARLSGAKLDHAQLQGASLKIADLRGASLVAAQLQGALLDTAFLNGASLNSAQLQGASLVDAFLRGAWLDGVPVQGGSPFTQLQGANLNGAELTGASLRGGAMVWRTDARQADLKGARIVGAESRPKYHQLDCNRNDPCDWSAESYAALRRLIETSVPQGAYRASALERIAILDPAKELDGETEAAMTDAWAGRKKTPLRAEAQSLPQPVDKSAAPPEGKPPLSPEKEAVLSPEEYEEILAEELRKAACYAFDPTPGDDSTTYVIRPIVAKMNPRLGGPAKAKLAAALLDGTKCQGTAGLSENDKHILRDFAKPPATAAQPARGRKAEP